LESNHLDEEGLMSHCSRQQGVSLHWTLFSSMLFSLVAAMFFLVPPIALCAQPGSKDPLTFERHVRPIFKAHCFRCHGGEGDPKGGLDLRLRRLMITGGDSGPSIVEKDSASSYLYQRLIDGEMPPEGEPLTPQQIQLIGQWIDSGAATARPEPVSIKTGTRITPEDREYWAFQPVRRPALPHVVHSELVRTPVDAFLLSRLEAEGLTFSASAERMTLLRRATFDLVGLPPTPDEVATFLSDESPDAYERLIDRLLESPHYGERWGRHWLDVAGYADSEGYTDVDTPRPNAFRYRDWVIRALNADMPMDRFVREQLAGDEMVEPPYKDLSPDEIDRLTATGFLRMAADGTATGGIDQNVARNQVIADTIKIVSTSLLGMSVGCAQCHDHRYDPILQADYYRLRAVFEPALDWKAWRTPPQRRISLYTDEDRQRAAAVEAEASKIVKQRASKLEQYISDALEIELAKHPEELREPLRIAFRTAGGNRSPGQSKLLAENPSVNITGGNLYQYNPKAADDLKQLNKQIATVRSHKPPEGFVRALAEPKDHLPTTYLFHRGDYRQPEDAITPGGLTICRRDDSDQLAIPENDTTLPSSGRRLAYAKWLTNGRHPLVARVMVNRVWMHHFGRGIVETPSDFGNLGTPPTHPELLDWLADQFVTAGWSLKSLHRLIMNSTAYRQSSARSDAGNEIDFNNRLYSRMSVRRLDAEAIRDSILAVSGVLNQRMFGPAIPIRADDVGQIVVAEDAGKSPTESSMFRRSVYIQVRRSQPLGVLRTFDAPVMETNCVRRPTSTVATQALLMMNSNFQLRQAKQFAQRIQREAGTDLSAQIDRAWQLAYQRAPQASERETTTEFLKQQVEHLVQAAVDKDKSAAKAPSAEQRLQALTNLCQVLLSSNEFLYVD